MLFLHCLQLVFFQKRSAALLISPWSLVQESASTGQKPCPLSFLQGGRTVILDGEVWLMSSPSRVQDHIRDLNWMVVNAGNACEWMYLQTNYNIFCKRMEFHIFVVDHWSSSRRSEVRRCLWRLVVFLECLGGEAEWTCENKSNIWSSRFHFIQISYC